MSEEEWKARAEAAEATLAEATSATMMAEMRADKLQAETARLREALDAIHGIASVATVSRFTVLRAGTANNDIERIVKLCVPHIPSQET